MSLQSHKGQRLPLANRVIPVDANCAALFHYDLSENDVLTGIAPNSGAVFTLRPDGKFGGGIAVEESTTNLLAIANSKWSINKNNFQGTMYVTTGSYSRFTTSARFDFQPRADIPAGGGWQLGQYAVDLTWNTAQTYTWSIYVKRLTTDHISIRLLDSNGTNQQGPIVTTTNATAPIGQWARLTATWTPSITNGGTVFYITAGETASFECADPQVEQKSFATSFVSGNRSAGSLDYPVKLNHLQGTIAVWVYVNSEIKDIADYRHILSVNTANGRDDGLTLFHDSGAARFRLKCVNDAGTATNIFIADSLVPDGWRLFVARWTAQELACFVDGVKVGSGATPNLPTGYASTISIGHELQIRQANTVLDELRIDNIARTDDEILAWYHSNSPFWPKGIYKAGY